MRRCGPGPRARPTGRVGPRRPPRPAAGERRGGARSWPPRPSRSSRSSSRSSRPRRPGCASATPTTSPRGTWGWSASPSCCSWCWTSPSGLLARPAAARRRAPPCAPCAAGAALLSFYVTYLAYRNLKAIIPLLRPGDLFDRQIAEFERGVFGGQDPAALLHALLGTGIPTHVLSTVYAAFIVFLPLSLALALVFSPDLSTSLFFATALSFNWLLGAGTYFLLPALGPVYADPELFASLPHSEVTRLQGMLLDDRIAFLRDPAAATPQAIAAFASLHIAMSFTALAAAHLLDLGRRLKVALWVWLVVTIVATIYFGWHYVIDDVAGIVIGGLSLLLAQLVMGYDLRAARRVRRRPAR